MTSDDHTDAASTPAPEPELPELAQPSSSRGKILGVAVGLALAVGVFGGIGKISGTGWFSYRTLLYEGGELYVLNDHKEARFASVDGLEEVEIPASNAQRLELIGGASQVVITKADGSVDATYTVELNGSHALLKLVKGQCLGAFGVDSYYKSGGSGVPALERKIRADEQLVVLGSRNVIWPRKSFPKRLQPNDGPALSVELVGCELLDDEEFLISYVGHRLAERFKSEQQEGGGDVEIVRPRL